VTARSNAAKFRDLERNLSMPKKQKVEPIPAPPEWLSESAQTAWREIVPLIEPDILRTADGPALALLCATYAAWRQLSRDIEGEGYCYEAKTSAGATMQRPNPKVRFLSDASRRLAACLNEFGLTPASARKKPADDDSSFFERGVY